jgi:DNA polymerase-3 subunit delta'
MGFRPIYGHDALRNRLGGALVSGRFPQVALFTGPPGVGKQRLALWVAQGTLCDRGPGPPCDDCAACRSVTGLTHPDLHWFVPIPRPKATDPGKQVEEARDLLGEVMAVRRERPLYGPPERMASHSLASVRLLRRVMALTPFSGSRKVVILGDAERLIVQEASQEAANALLKLLEEPPADATVILTAADPEALLPTIRSRAVPLRVGRVPDDAVHRFVETELERPPAGDALQRRVALAEGCIGRTIDEHDRGTADRRARELLAAAQEGPQAWTLPALSQPPWSARGDFSATLDALALELRDRLQRSAAAGDGRAPHWLQALRLVEERRAEAQGNANPQLALAVLAGELERVL